MFFALNNYAYNVVFLGIKVITSDSDVIGYMQFHGHTVFWLKPIALNSPAWANLSAANELRLF